MNIKDAYIHVGPSGTNEKALLKDFAITASQITLTRAILNANNDGDKTETITIPTWNLNTTGSAATLTTSRNIWGQSFNGSSDIDGTLFINGTHGSYTEGIRIKPSSSGWTTILLGGTDLTANTGTSALSWSLHTYQGEFFINKNSANQANATRLWGHSNGWTIGNTSTTTYALNVGGTAYTTAAMLAGSYVKATTYLESTTYTKAGSYMLAGTYVTAGSYVNATTYVRASGNDLYIGSASGSQCHEQYDSTNKCLKFIFD